MSPEKDWTHDVENADERGARVTEQGWRRITLKFIHEHVPE